MLVKKKGFIQGCYLFQNCVSSVFGWISIVLDNRCFSAAIPTRPLRWIFFDFRKGIWYLYLFSVILFKGSKIDLLSVGVLLPKLSTISSNYSSNFSNASPSQTTHVRGFILLSISYILMLYFSLDKPFSVFLTKLVFQLLQVKFLVLVHHFQFAIRSLGPATLKWVLRLSWRIVNFCNLKVNNPTKYLQYAKIRSAYVYMEALCFSISHIYRMTAYCCLTVAHYMLKNFSMSAQRMCFHQLLRYSVMACISLNRSFHCSDQ